MKRSGRLIAVFSLLLAAILAVSCSAGAGTLAKKRKKTPKPTATAVVTAAPTEKPAGRSSAEPTEEPGPIIEPQRIADWLFEYGELPDNFITKQEAMDLGWDKRYNYVSDVAPGKSIGGDYFGNYQGKLPRVRGRTYYEADCWYTEGPRNWYRIIYSSDGHVWYTDDHYNTFTEMKPSGP